MGERIQLPYALVADLAGLIAGGFHPSKFEIELEDKHEDEVKLEGLNIEHQFCDEDIDEPDIEDAHSIPDIESVIFSGPATTIIWADGEKTTVKCAEGQTFDRYAGFTAAVCKRLFGSTAKAQALMDEKDVELRAEKRAAEKAKRAEEEKNIRRKQTGENYIPTFDQFNSMVNKRLVERAVEEAVEEIVVASLKQQRVKQATDDIFAAMRKEEEKKDV